MTEKEKFLEIKTYEEFDRRRAEFKELSMKDKEIREHAKKISPIIKNYTEEEVYTFFPDGSKMIGGPGMKAVKEKGYKSVDDYYKRMQEESSVY